ncbi:MAG: ribonuclease P protein component [Desulfuromonadales bacterium]
MSLNEEEQKDVNAYRFELPSNKYPGVMVEFRAAKLPKEARLRKRSEFLILSGAQHKTFIKGFIVVWQDNAGATARLGITVSKKIGCAVVRNRLKRFLREIFRRNRMLIAAVDMNIIARRESALMNYFEVQWEINKAFSLIGVSSCPRV